jgi:hypothetical protein
MDPFFSPYEHAVNEALIPAHLLAVGELVKKSPPKVQQHIAFGPFLQAAVDGTFRAVPLWQLTPGSASPQDPKDAFKAFAVIERRATSLARGLALWQMWFDGFPLFISDCSPSHGLPP